MSTHTSHPAYEVAVREYAALGEGPTWDAAAQQPGAEIARAVVEVPEDIQVGERRELHAWFEPGTLAPGTSFVLTVEDDGNGVDHAGGTTGTGLGTRIINAVARSLGGKVTALDRPSGTAVEISVNGRPATGKST